MTYVKSKGLMSKHVKISSDLPTEHLKKELSHLGPIANMKIEH